MGAEVTRAQIVTAAISLLGRGAWETVSIKAVAREAGVSRQTVYAHFPTRDDLYSAVMIDAANVLVDRNLTRVRDAETGAELVLSLMVSCVRDFREDPTTSAIGLVRPGQVLAPDALAIVKGFLAPLVELEPQLEPDLDEVAETMVRFMLSFVMYDSERTRTDEALRGYLERRLLPALGLPVPPDTA
jgi:AcrR family transcriptional regulator